MLELTRKQTTKGFAEFCIKVPEASAAKLYAALKSILDLAEIPVENVNKDGEKVYSFDEVFPDHHSGDTVRGLRLREELTQKQLAEKIGAKQHHISEIENGKRSISIEMAKRLATALGTEYKVFL
ncbi:Helix-turn-helix [Maridesulfovibrio ferrireducens]|uniref:Helix-turn-helix n=1 Tax=Maridesulfovibrio ferrireducens TaxID=246191 RepID=A0A1G9EMT2_9BACT|nr:helix-turn-helix transcriptional regulator [Maridesulfovibrio ferrireducens]SDK77507.1 Helix-turn-helix [Maridesulfovibrio ferrireducens]